MLGLLKRWTRERRGGRTSHQDRRDEMSVVLYRNAKAHENLHDALVALARAHSDEGDVNDDR